MQDFFDLVKGYSLEHGLEVRHQNRQNGILVLNHDQEGIINLIVCIAPPIIIFEQFIFEIGTPGAAVYMALLQKNRDMIHGAFVLDESGRKVIFRNTLQVETLDRNEFESTINALSLLLSEYSEQIIHFSKK